MRPRSTEALALLAVGTLPWLLSTACYNPAIKEGGLQCASGRRCPDGYTCEPDGFCWHDLMCTAPAATPACDQGAPPGSCNPICQTQCACGRCNYNGNGVACTPPGTKQIGDVCTPGSDDCDTGLACLAEACGIGRCYKFCAWISGSSSIACPSTSAGCHSQVNDTNGNQTDYMACDQPPSSCDPVKGTGCSNSALACYTNGTVPFCDCKGSKQSGQQCGPYNDCQPGYLCLLIGAGGNATCVKACAMSTDCTSGQNCNKITATATYGYCG
jgi:hypothetical protein